ncbi:Sec-independent protein translocase TatB [Streptomyces tateyamensis]|uniref:Sec-independent protein translocase protein TatB n=1 Tax=Streptomyces tateyamensis TaxID=565073 RepID=A0A2V4N308_9ACTN|nr:sec-independent translocase [Streptomyces tateyamensis]PYC72161.1 Sec-independent protein translocase TatB [Streptomyces tateyamensis]
MFFDIGPLEMVTLAVMAIVIFGPDKLPKLIQDAVGFIRKVRSFADSAKADIRSELGPEFKDFEFEDLNPKTFVRKNLIGENPDPLGFKALREDLDIRTVLDDKPAAAATPAEPAAARPAVVPLTAGERAPFDPDAT